MRITLYKLAVVAGVLATAGLGLARAQTAEQATAITHVLRLNAAEQTQLASELAKGRLTAHSGNFMQAQQAALYRMESLAMELGAPAPSLDALAGKQERTIVVFAPPRPGATGTAAARVAAMHERVTAQRDAEQQREIANAWDAGHLTLQEVAELEAGQARLARMQVRIARDGAESDDQALRLQHQQDIQDWAIARAIAAS